MFEKFLCGDTLEQCYDAVASIANRWLDLLEVSRHYHTISRKLFLLGFFIHLLFCRTMGWTLPTVSYLIISLSQVQ